MQYANTFPSPVGQILLTCDDIGLTGLFLEGGKSYAAALAFAQEEKEHPIFADTKRWLTVYFSGKEPDFMPPVHITGSAFRMEVWHVLSRIPYGKTTTYGEIARTIARKKGLAKMSPQAVGNAVGHNPISILIPCHRVVGTNGSLTGYAAGIDRKVQLLTLEGVDMTALFVPKKAQAVILL